MLQFIGLPLMTEIGRKLTTVFTGYLGEQCIQDSIFAQVTQLII